MDAEGSQACCKLSCYVETACASRVVIRVVTRVARWMLRVYKRAASCQVTGVLTARGGNVSSCCS